MHVVVPTKSAPASIINDNTECSATVLDLRFLCLQKHSEIFGDLEFLESSTSVSSHNRISIVQSSYCYSQSSYCSLSNSNLKKSNFLFKSRVDTTNKRRRRRFLNFFQYQIFIEIKSH